MLSRVLFITWVTFLMAPLGFGGQIYNITNLGAGSVRAINDSGQVLGSDSVGAWLYLNGVKQYLPQPATGTFIPEALNNFGEVVGYVNFPNQTNYALATYQNGVLTLSGLSGLSPSAVNDRGQIVGTQVSTYQGFSYSNGVLSILSGLPYDVNNSGIAVGTTLETNRRAFSYQNGQISYLAPPGATTAEAHAINDSGEIVGFFGTATTPLNRVFIYLNGSYQELGSALNAPVETDAAFAVNNSALIVGNAETLAGLVAWSYDSTFGFSNLNAGVNASGWLLQTAYDVNGRGQIIGNGTFNGQQTTYLLTPIPEPDSWALGLIGFAVLVSGSGRYWSSASSKFRQA